MRIRTVLIFITVLMLSGCGKNDLPSLAPVKTVSDNYYGTLVNDDYRYMENMDDTVFLSWMKEYSQYTRKLLHEIPGRDSIYNLMEKFHARKSDKVIWAKITRSGRYFYLKMKPEDEVPKLYYRDDYNAEESLLYDPENYSDDINVHYAIDDFYPDYEGKRACISLAVNGSENRTLLIIDVASKELLADRIDLFLGSITWMRNGDQFIYGKSNSADVHDPDRFLNTKLYLHEIGNSVSRDVLVFSSDLYPETGMRKEEIPYIIYDYDQDDYYLLLNTVDRYLKLFHSNQNGSVPGKRYNWKPLVRQEDQIQNLAINGDELYLYTARNAPGFEILKTSVSKPDIKNAEIIIPESSEGMISSFTFTNEALYYTLKINGVEEKLFRMPNGDSLAHEVKLPAKAGTLSLRTRGYKFPDIWVSIHGWTVDGRRYRFNSMDESFVPEPLSSRAEYPEFRDLMVEELMIPSHDGVMVPLSIIYMKGTPLNGEAPLIMTGYGAYGNSRKPAFNPYMLSWTLKGGIFAVSHVRGGGELGDSWRLGGHKETKANSWKDFIASAEYLIDNNYTSPEHFAIYALSAGGILIGRAITERPDLFAAAIPIVGVMNPLRAEQSPNGPVNAPEFGTVKDSAECMGLIAMDPYVNITDGVDYPATLITAGFNDPRVIVWQPAKFAAKLQASNHSRNPILFNVDYSSGHGVGNTKAQEFEEIADLFSFALWQTKHKEFQK